MLAYLGGQQYRNPWEDPCGAMITKYTRPEAAGALLRIIFGLQKRACQLCCHWYRLPISDKWMSATNRNIHYTTCQAWSHWCYIDSVHNSSSFGPGRFYRSAWPRPYPFTNRRFFTRTITLWPQILIREFSVWYVNYAALHGASFGCLRFSISSNLSKRKPKNLVFGPKMTIILKQLAEFRRYQKSQTAKSCAAWSCIFHVPNTLLSDQYWWT